jgi:hypothetical protein
MLVSGNDILNYEGNKNLGADGSAGIDVDTSKLQETVYNMAYLNLQKNKAVWEQKIKDRDDTMDLIRKGELQLGKVPPEYRDQIRAKMDRAKALWLEKGGDLKSDSNDWIEFNDLLADAQDGKAYGQSKLAEYNKEAQLAAKETNPRIKKEILANMEAQMKADLYEPYMPYQQRLDYDPKKIFKDLDMKVLRTGVENDYDFQELVTDVIKARKTYYDDYVYDQDGDTAHHFDTFLGSWLGNDGGRDHATIKENLDIVNRKLYNINTELGLKQGDEGFLTPLTIKEMQDGKLQTGDTTADAVYKIALATQYQKSMNKKLNLDYAKKRKLEEEAKTEASKRNLNNANANKARAQGRYWDSKSTETENVNNVYNIFDDVVARAELQNFQSKDKDGKPIKNEEKNVVFFGKVPDGFGEVLSGVDADGKPIPIEWKKTSSGAKYLDVVKSDFYINQGSGRRYSKAEIQNAYRSQSQFKTFDQFLKHMEGKGLKQQVELEGTNGRATAQSTIQALRALNNKNSNGKYDQTIFDDGDNDEAAGGGTTNVGSGSASSTGGSASVSSSDND